MTDTDNSYAPVSCTLHSELELAIMHSTMLTLLWTDENNIAQQRQLTPIDLETSNRQEFLIARDEHRQHYRIRLDRISVINQHG